MGARFYDPNIGRWLSEDPVQDKHFEPASLNFYTYVLDNPVNLIDPDGQTPISACGIICGRLLQLALRTPLAGRIAAVAGGATVGGRVLEVAVGSSRTVFLTMGWYNAQAKTGFGFAKILGKHLDDFVGKFGIAKTEAALRGLLKDIMNKIAQGNVHSIVSRIGAQKIEYIVKIGEDKYVRVVTTLEGELITAFPVGKP